MFFFLVSPRHFIWCVTDLSVSLKSPSWMESPNPLWDAVWVLESPADTLLTLLHDGAGEATALLQEGEARLGVRVLLSPGWSSSGWTSWNTEQFQREENSSTGVRITVLLLGAVVQRKAILFPPTIVFFFKVIYLPPNVFRENNHIFYAYLSSLYLFFNQYFVFFMKCTFLPK